MSFASFRFARLGGRVCVLAAVAASVAFTAHAETFEEGAKRPVSAEVSGKDSRIESGKESEKNEGKAIQQALANSKNDDGSAIQRATTSPTPVTTVPEPKPYGMYALGLILMVSVAVRRLSRSSQNLSLPRR